MDLAWKRLGQAGSGHRNEAVETLENMRCDNIEANERAEAREEARAKAAQEVIKHEQSAASAARFRQIRSVPKAPPANATRKEIEIRCRQQEGEVFSKGSTLACVVGGELLFACEMHEDRARRVDTVYEGADVDALRTMIETKLGPAKAELANGVTVFMWPHAGMALRIHERGAQTTVLAPSP